MARVPVPLSARFSRAAAVGRLLAALLFAGPTLALGAADENTVISPRASAGGAPGAAPAAPLNSLSLLAAVVLAATGGWIYWKNRRGTPLGRDRRALAVDETRSLGNRQFLVVASYEGRKFLLGVCPGRIDLLANLDDRDAAGAAVPPGVRPRE
jgi:flagellar protein FliO/FliZ